MGSNFPVRPLPTALQRRDSTTHRRSCISFTSAESSVNHSVESSYFLSGSKSSSQTSHSSTAPLPKGARPPSPQMSFAYQYTGARQEEQARTSSHGPKSTSWTLEWRGFSRIIKWAVLGNKIAEPDGPRRLPRSSGSSHSNRVSSFLPVAIRPSPEDLRGRNGTYDKGSYSTTVPTPTLSPENSTTCLNITYEHERLVAHSEMGHNIDYTSYGESTFDTCRRGHQQPKFSSVEHVAHVQSRTDTNAQNARSEHGQCKQAALWESHPIPESGDAMLLNSRCTSSTYFHPNQFPTSHSDIGHSGAAVPFEHPSGMASFISNGLVPFSAHPSGGLWPHSSTLNSTATLPVSSGLRNDFLSMDRRRPRKLQKSNRIASTPQSIPGHGFPLAEQKGTLNRRLSTKHAPSVASRPSTQPPRPPRKLTKKPSPQLPPTPDPSQSDEPPPIPPKPPSILRNKNEHPLPPLPLPPAPSPTPNHSSNSSAPALTDTSQSTSSENDLTGYRPSRQQLVIERPQRPSILRTESNRRWTVAVADVPDDMFIEEFERLRRMGLRSGEVHGVTTDHSQASLTVPAITDVISSEGVEAKLEGNGAGHHTLTKQVDNRDFAFPGCAAIEDDVEWTHARKAIMCCRELVRTERSYQARLQDLLEGQVCDTVPRLLLQYLPALIIASKIFSSHLNEDMSTVGVSHAFIRSESVLEGAFTAWSGVVGGFFGRKPEGQTLLVPKHKRGATITEISLKQSHAHELGEEICRTKSMHVHNEVYVVPAVDMADPKHDGGRTRRTASMQWLFRPAFQQSPSDENITKDSVSNLRKSIAKGPGTRNDRKKRKPSFRELAILPTQRITRYVLLYKDLLKHTTNSSQSCDIVVKAVECAESIARKCDRAQDNATFLR